MVRPLFYRTDSHRSGLEDVKRRHGTNGKSEVTERGPCSAAVASPFFTLLQLSHVLYSLYISHRVLYNSRFVRVEYWSRRPRDCEKMALNGKRGNLINHFSIHF